MVVRLVRPDASRGAASPAGNRGTVRLTCSFVNNMPDGAFDATERQFLDLLAVGSGDDMIEVRRHAMNGIKRDPTIKKYIQQNYLPLSGIRQAPPDVLIVTGSNPIEVDIVKERYWDELSELLVWGSTMVSSMLLSCLAAHAALLVFDGIARMRLDQKCSGVFSQSVDKAHPLGMGIGPRVLLPHSRINTSDTDRLRERGYSIVVESETVGWGVANKTIGECEVIFMQAHPEYEPPSLLREYRRDARRYVVRERVEKPVLPYHCVAGDDWDSLQELHRTLTPNEEGVKLLEDYPFEGASARAAWPWRDMAQQLYANWLASVGIEKGATDA